MAGLAASPGPAKVPRETMKSADLTSWRQIQGKNCCHLNIYNKSGWVKGSIAGVHVHDDKPARVCALPGVLCLGCHAQCFGRKDPFLYAPLLGFVLETGSPVAKAGLKLPLHLRISLNV